MGGSRRLPKHAEEAAVQARSRRDRAGLAQSLELAALSSPTSPAASEALEEAVALWSELGSRTGTARAELLAGLVSKDAPRAEAATATLRSLGVRSPRALRRLLAKVGLVPEASGHAEPSASVQALGRFRVLVEGVPVSPKVWQSRKARDLLKILVARQGRPVHAKSSWTYCGRTSRLPRWPTGFRSPLVPYEPCWTRRSERRAIIMSSRHATACRLDTDHVEVDVEKFLARAVMGMDRAAPMSLALSSF